MFAIAFLSEKVARLRGQEANLNVMGVKTLSAKLQATSALAEREFGAKFRPLEETLLDTTEWFRENEYVKTSINIAPLATEKVLRS